MFHGFPPVGKPFVFCQLATLSENVSLQTGVLFDL